MSIEQMPLGNYPTFPSDLGHGISYRQWLIGQAAAGLAANGSGPITSEQMAILSIKLADDILKRLDREAK